MTSKERVRHAVQYQQPDRVPADFEAVGIVWDRLQKRYGYWDPEQVLRRFEINIRVVNPLYIGPERKTFTDQDAVLRGWVQILWKYCASAMRVITEYFNMTLARWIKFKYRQLHGIKMK